MELDERTIAETLRQRAERSGLSRVVIFRGDGDSVICTKGKTAPRMWKVACGTATDPSTGGRAELQTTLAWTAGCPSVQDGKLPLPPGVVPPTSRSTGEKYFFERRTRGALRTSRQRQNVLRDF